LPAAGQAGRCGAPSREQETRIVEVVDDGRGHDEHRSHAPSVPVVCHSRVTTLWPAGHIANGRGGPAGRTCVAVLPATCAEGSLPPLREGGAFSGSRAPP